MMKESAISRTPVEIWHNIFEFALQWPELPTEDDAPLTYINFDWKSCRRYHLYSFSLHNRQNLRFVCRSWRQMIDAGHAPYAIAYLWKGQTAFSRRGPPISIWNFGECISTATSSRQCTPPCPQGFASTPQYNAESRSYDIKLDQSPDHEHLIPLLPINEQTAHAHSGENGPQMIISRTKLLFILSQPLTTSKQFSSLLKYAKNLRALAWGPKYPSDLCSLSHLTSLTMFRVWIQIGQDEWLTREIILPTLRHLHVYFRGRLGFDTSTPINCSEEPMAKWDFPNLTVLEVVEHGWGVGHIIASFVSRHCDTITALVFDSSSWPHDDRWYGKSSLWTSLNRLSLVGVSPYWFSQSAPRMPTPVSPSGTPLTIFLYNFMTDWQTSKSGAVEHASHLVDWCESLSCGVQLISVNKSWRDVRTWVKPDDDSLVQERFGTAKAVLEEVTRGGIPLYDRDGILLPSGDVTSFLESE